MEASDTKRLKNLEAENRNLKQMYADLSLENEALKDILDQHYRFDLAMSIGSAAQALIRPTGDAALRRQVANRIKEVTVLRRKFEAK